MNTSYKSIWNESLGAWVAASEVTKGRGKRSRSGAAVAVALAVLAGVAGLSSQAFAAGDFEAVGTPGTGAITVSPSGSSTNASAAGTNAIAVGTSATAPAVSAVAVGVNATAGVSGGGSGAAALGSGTKATGESSVAIGGGNGTGNSENNNAAVASADRSVAVGHNSNATAVNAVAIGTDAIASGSGSVAIGADAGGTATANVANAGAKATGPYSIAVGGMSQATGQSALAFGTGATAVFGNDMAFGTNAYASGDSSSLAPSTAFGNKSKATNYGTAFGVGAQALSYGSIAFGGDAKSGVDGGTRGVAMGVLAAVSGDRGVAIGAGASSAGDRAVAYGWKTSAAASGAVAIGANADGGAAALEVGSIAIGGQSSVASGATSGIALGRGATTKGAFGIAQGDGATASEKNAIGIGTNAAASDANAIAVGDASKARGINSIAMGHQANAAGSHATALGADASALYDDSVALGSSSKTSATLAALQSTAAHTPFKGATIAGATPAGEVSVGADGSERRVTNVAAGGAGTDAVNVSQLQAASTAAVQYDKNADGTLNKGSVTLGGTPATAPVKLGNVADGNVAAGSKDAVNGGQLNTTNQNVTNLGDSIRNGAIGPVQAVPGKTGQLTLVAPGATGAAPGNAQVLGNVAAGKAPTDAANVGQLDALAGSAVQYDKNADGTPDKSHVTLGGKNADGTPATAPVKLGNVADGNVAAGSKDAVNGGQLNAVSEMAGKGWSLSANGEGAGAQKIAPGDTVDFINGSNTTVSRAGKQIKVDVSKTPVFDSVTAASGTPGAPGSTSATLGANGLTTNGADGKAGPSVTTAGIDAGGKAVTNVGAGTNDTDAANVAQVKAAQANAGNAVQYDRNADGTPGKSGVTLGGLNADGTPATAPVKLANVADGNVAAGSKDAVNGGQLNTTNQNVTNLGDSIRNGAIGPVQAVPGKTDQLTLVAPGATGAAPGNAQVLSNVANGTAPNDAVNRGQLDTVSAAINKGWNLSANGEASPLNIAPGGAVDFINGSNTTVIRTGNQIKVDVSKTPVFDSVTAASGTPGAPGSTSTTLGANGLTTTGADGKAGPSVTTAGIDAGGKPITNVGAGTNDTDAANVAQVKAVEAKADNAVQYDAKDGAPGKDSITLGGLNADGTPATAPVKLANVADGNVAAGSKDAVNGGQLNTTNQNVTNLGDSIRNGSIGPVQAVPGKTNQLTLVAPGATGAAPGDAQVLGNVAAGKAPTDAANVGQLDALAGSTVQYDKNADGTPGKNGVTLGGLNADGTPATAPVKLGNVADGNVAAGSKDAVNGGQLNAVSETAKKGWNLSANGEASPLNIAPGGAVDFINGSNTTVSRAGNQIKVDVSKTPTFESVTATAGTPGNPGASATLGANGLTTTGADGKAGPSVTTAGIDAGGKPVSNVGAGEKDTDAANVAQVKAVEAKADNAVQYDAKDGAPGKDSITLGGLNADGTPATAPVKLANVADGNVAAGSKDAVNGGQLNTTNQNVTNLGDSIRNGSIGPVQAVPGKTNQLTLVAPGATGAAPGNAQVLGNVAAGKAPTDAANVGQLDALAGSAVQYDKNADGTPGKNGVTLGGLNADGTPATAPVKLGNVADGNVAAGSKDAVNGGQLNAVRETANKGWNLSANGEASPLNIAPGGAVDFINGSNTTVSRAGNQIKVDVSKTPTFESVTATNGTPGNPGASATLGANGLTTTGADGKAGPRVTTAGIDAGGKPVTNVGAGTNDTDAANVAQVKAVEAKADNAVQYDAKDGAPGKDSITLGGLNTDGTPATAPVKLANVADGNVAAGSKDAVNGGQLNTTNQNVTKLGDSIANGTIGPVQAVPGKTNQLTLVAPGATGDAPGNAQVLSNVADGKAPTDAANVGQLDALAGSAVQYDKNADGTPGKNGVTLGGLNADGTAATAPVKLGNVADGNVAAGSKDAVNGGQLNTTNQNVTNLGDSIRNGSIGPVQAVPGKTNQLTLVAPGATGDAPGNAQVLSNVADGTAPNDAVNRGQLDTVSATANKGWNLSANGEASPLNIAPGGAVDFINGSNTTVIRTGNQIKVDVSKTPTFESVTATNGAPGNPGASATLGANGLTTTGADGKAGPSVTTAGIDAGGKPIGNVGAGTNDTDAANVAQVKAVEAKADNAVQYDAKDGAPGKESITLGGLNADGTPATAPVKLANVADGNVAAGSKDAVNGGQLNTTNQNVTKLGDSMANGTIGPVQAVPGKTDQLTLVAPGATGDAPGNAQVLSNVADGKAPTDAANVGQLDALAGSAVQYDKNADGTPGKSAVTLGGKNADGTPATDPVKLGNVADGNVAAGSKDAVNGGQLNTTNSNTNTFLGGGADVASGKAPTYDVAGGSFNDVGSALGAVDRMANKGWNLSANGEVTPQQIVPGGAVDFINGSNTTVIRTGNQIKVDVSKTPTFESVTATNGAPGNPGASATLGANGLTTTGADGTAGPSVTTAGIDAGGKPVTNVGAGTNDTDAANVAQVKAVEAKADNAVQYDAKDGAPGKESITLGGLNADGTPATAPVKLANVADGNVAAGSKDAINGGQLNTLGSGIANVLGGTYVGGVYTPSAFTTVGGGSATTVQGALDNLGTVVSNGAVGPVQRTGKDDQLALVAPGATGAAPGAAQQLTNVKNGELSSTSTDAVNGSQLHAVSEAVAAVGTKADNSVQYDKGADGAPGKAGITLGGMGADGKTPSTGPVKLGNVADGNLAADSKDAVNGGQLFATNQNVTNLGNDLKNLSTSVNDGKVGPLQRTDNANELVLVGKDGTAANPGAAQRVTNVANGTGAGDAVNFGQLQEVANTANNSVQYDGADKGAVTMGGATSTDGGKTGGTRLGNVAQGAVNDKSTDAVNGAQLNATHTAVSNYLGGGANLNEGKAPSYNVQGNTYDNVGGALGSVNDNLTTVNNAINGGGMKYFRANSTLPDATAGGTDAVAVGPQAVASGASSVAVGSGAQATSASGTAIGFKAVVQQTGGVALGAGSVASTAAGVAGHVPEGAGAQQASAVRATTSTQGAVSVGDAGNGQFRQITGVAAGTADSDAANVAQLKASASAVKAGSVQYDTHADGSVNHGQITMGNGQAPDGTRISNVAPGVQGTDAVNLNQLNSAAAASMNYTDARFNQLGNAMRDIEKKSYAGTAAAMALENAPYVPGKVSYAAGMGHYQGQTAVGASLRKTAESGRWSVSGGVTATSAGTVGVRAGISGVWD